MVVVVIGSSNMDLCLSMARLPQRGETVIGSDSKWSIGGKGANQAVAASRLGREPCHFLTCMGEDNFAESISTKLVTEGVLTTSVTISSSNLLEKKMKDAFDRVGTDGRLFRYLLSEVVSTGSSGTGSIPLERQWCV